MENTTMKNGMQNMGTQTAPVQSIVSGQELDTSRIHEEIKNGYINVQWHESGILQILNYSQKAQFDWRWNNETMICRGLIVDEDFNVIARPFPKFFSYEQLNGVVPSEPFEVFDKLDGSLGILYWFLDEPAIATRGSFESPQAKFATKLLRTKYKNVQFNPLVTYLFEIIYPQNRIVVDYGEREELVLLACIQTSTGAELPLPDSFPMPIVERFYGISDITQITNQQKPNSEGFVCRFKTGQRVKFKFDEYKRLHKLLTGVGERHIWELLKNGQGLETLIERVPDEFYGWVRDVEQRLKSEYSEIEIDARSGLDCAPEFESRKQAANYIRSFNYPSVMFAMLDEKDYSELIWKMIKPTGQAVFKCESLSH